MNRKIYVANLPWGVNSDELKSHFSKVGEVLEATVILDRDTGRSRGFGFVKMRTEEDAEKAIKEFNLSGMDGRQLVVKEAEDKPERESSEFIKKIKDFVLSGTEHSMGFIVDSKHFTITRNEDETDLANIV